MKLKRNLPKPNFWTEESEITRLMLLEGKARQENIHHVILASLKFLAIKGIQDLTRDELWSYTGFNRQRFIKALKYLIRQYCVERVGCGIKKQPYRYQLAGKELLELLK